MSDTTKQTKRVPFTQSLCNQTTTLWLYSLHNIPKVKNWKYFAKFSRHKTVYNCPPRREGIAKTATPTNESPTITTYLYFWNTLQQKYHITYISKSTKVNQYPSNPNLMNNNGFTPFDHENKLKNKNPGTTSCHSLFVITLFFRHLPPLNSH